MYACGSVYICSANLFYKKYNRNFKISQNSVILADDFQVLFSSTKECIDAESCSLGGCEKLSYRYCCNSIAVT